MNSYHQYQTEPYYVFKDHLGRKIKRQVNEHGEWVDTFWNPQESSHSQTDAPLTPIAQQSEAQYGVMVSSSIRSAAEAMMKFCHYDLRLSQMPGLRFMAFDGETLGNFSFVHYEVTLANTLTEEQALETTAHEMYHAYQGQRSAPKRSQMDVIESEAKRYSRFIMNNTTYIKLTNGQSYVQKRR